MQAGWNFAATPFENTVVKAGTHYRREIQDINIKIKSFYDGFKQYYLNIP